MNTKSRRWIPGCLIALVLTLAAAASIFFFYPNDHAIRPVSDRAEKATAETLLAHKLSGPRYFNASAEASPDDGGLWIDVADAWPQVPRIAAERKLGPAATRELGRLIEKLSEPHPYRVVGGERINLPRLNLSLDTIK